MELEDVNAENVKSVHDDYNHNDDDDDDVGPKPDGETGSCRAEFNPTSCLHCCGFLCFFSDWTILKWLTLSVSRSFSVMRKQPCQVSEIQKSFIISLFNIFTRVFHCFKPNPTYC